MTVKAGLSCSRPADFSIRYEWQAGSMPPPHHYEYTIRIRPNQTGEIEFCPDYAFNNPPIWIEAFPIDEEALDALYRKMVTRDIFQRNWAQLDQPPVGGSLQWMELSADGAHVSVPVHLMDDDEVLLSELYAAIRALVPNPIWSKLQAQRDAYEAAYEGR